MPVPRQIIRLSKQKTDLRATKSGGVDQIDVYDSNQPIKYLRAMDDKDISEVNRKLNTVQIK